MTSITKFRTDENGRLSVCLWAGGNGPNLDDPSVWHTLEEFESELQKAAQHTHRGGDQIGGPK